MARFERRRRSAANTPADALAGSFKETLVSRLARAPCTHGRVTRHDSGTVGLRCQGLLNTLLGGDWSLTLACENAIVRVVMRGSTQPAGLFIVPSIGGFQQDMSDRLPFNPDRARALLAEAGYPNGFPLTLDLPQIPLHYEPQVYGILNTVENFDLVAQEDVRMFQVRMRP